MRLCAATAGHARVCAGAHRTIGRCGWRLRARETRQAKRERQRERKQQQQPVAVCASAANEGQWQGCCVQWPEPQQHGPRCVFKVILIPRRFAAACVRVRRVCRCARAISSRSVVLCPGRHWDSNFCDLRHHAGRPCARKKCAASVSCRPCSVLLSLILT